MSARPADDSLILLAATTSGTFLGIRVDAQGHEQDRVDLAPHALTDWVRRTEESEHPRWVLRSTREIYPALLSEGVSFTRAHDLVLCHAILRDTDIVARPLPPDERWLARIPENTEPALFDAEDRSGASAVDELIAQLQAQLRVLHSDGSGRLALLCAAESAGGLIAEEMHAAGLPWDATVHEGILTDVLGARSVAGGMPARMAEHAEAVRFHLGDPHLHLDSHVKLLRALHRVGVDVASTSQWELAEISHPVIAPLLAYKKLSRLLSANGWAWLTEWVHEGRFRPVYVPGGVVTGRWASAGGGALQLPRMLRPAVRADPGWQLIVADVAQLEPRMLAAMAADRAMAEAARGQDLYEGVVATGAVQTRQEAKYAVLGAMYGATTGSSGRLVPRLRKVYPRAMHLVDSAARAGEDGGVVSTRLGRSSPRPEEDWQQLQSEATGAEADAAVRSHARGRARERGRFTRNFVVQGTAAEWALIWLAEIRHRLRRLPASDIAAPASGPFSRHAHLAFFLHDEVILHVPAEQADAAASAVREAATIATRRLFGDFPIDVPLDLKIAENADK